MKRPSVLPKKGPWRFDGNPPGTGSGRPPRDPTHPDVPIEPADPVHPDALIESIAGEQHGVVSRAQLLDGGVPAHVIDYRVKRRRLRPIHAGVYRVGPLRGGCEREMGAVLACGSGAFISHRTAASLWKILPQPGPEALVDVSTQGNRRVPGPPVRLHRMASLLAEETTVLNGVPITNPGRTLLDLAGSMGERDLEQALATAYRDKLVSEEELTRLLERHPRRPGIPTLRALLHRDGGAAMARSEAESRFLSLVRRGKLPRPEVNVRVKAFEVDFLWRRERMVVEIDGFAYHSSREAFENDRHRDAVLAASGFLVFRMTWRQLVNEPEAALVLLAQALARTSAR